MFGRPGSIQLARIFGIRVGVDASWFAVLFILIFFLSDQFRQTMDSSDMTAYVTAVVSALLLFASVVVHELGHAVAARRQGIGVAGITISPLGGFALMSRESRTPREEFVVAAAGPAATLLVIAVCVVLDLLLVGPGRFLHAAVLSNDVRITPVLLTLSWLVTMNAIVLVFNLIPAYPLDGGRIARAVVWAVTHDRNRGTRAAARLGQGFALVLMGIGIWSLLAWDAIVGLWCLFVGFMIGGSARALLAQSVFAERLEEVSVADVMDEQPIGVPEELSAEQALDEFFLRYRWPWFPVVDADGRFVGVVREERVRDAVDRRPASGAGASDGPLTPVRELAETDHAQQWQIGQDQSLRALLESDGLRTLGAIMAVDGGGVLRGIVTAGRLRRALTAAVGTR
jgi:Zn-dependent protease